MTNMEKVAEMLGVKIGDEFNIKGHDFNPYHFSQSTLVNCNGNAIPNIIGLLLANDLEIEKIEPETREELAVKTLLDMFEDDMEREIITTLGKFQVGVTLNVIEKWMAPVDYNLAKKCKDLQHKVLMS